MEIPRRGFLQGLLAAAACASAPRFASASPETAPLDVLRARILAIIGPQNEEQAQNAIQTAERLAQSLRPDGTWATIDYADQSRSVWKTSTHVSNLLRIAVGFRTALDSHEGNAGPLESALASALKWWLDHDPHNPNWWHNEIGVPQLLGQTALFLGGTLTPDELDGIEIVLKRSNWSRWTGQNLVWGCQIQILRGLLDADPNVVAQAYARIYEEVRYGDPTGEGMMPDNSFHQHKAQLYSGGYGLNFANYVGALLFFSWDTPWQIPPEKLDIYSKYVLDGIAWMTRGPYIDYSTTGREITREGKAAVPSAGPRISSTFNANPYRLDEVTRKLASLNVPRSKEFAALAERLGQSPGAPEVNGNRHFWCSDYMTHRRPGFFTSVRMFSSRLINTEIINSEGKQSHHLADGCNFLYRSGDEYRDIFPVWDWSKIPGTTAEQMDLLQQPGGPHYTTDAAFVGGVSDGTYGLAAQELHRDTLRARKTWIMFDEGYVALGAGIRCQSGREVVTTMNQCLLGGEVIAPPRANYVWHDAVTYVFPKGVQFVFTHGDQTGRWSDIGVGPDELVKKQVFKLWVTHGKDPSGESYAYFVFPGVPASQASTLPGDPDLEIARNTPSIQAAWSRKLQLLGIAFWEAGNLSAAEWPSVRADQPCLVLVQKRSDRMRVSVSNPANLPLRVQVIVGVRLQGGNAVLRGSETTIDFDLPGGPLAGSTVTKEFQMAS